MATTVAECPECRSAGAVVAGRCQVCDAEIPEEGPPTLPGDTGPVLASEAVDLPPTASSRRSIRFSEVLGELRTISELAAADPDRSLEASRRAEVLLAALRAQFMNDVVEGRPT